MFKIIILMMFVLNTAIAQEEHVFNDMNSFNKYFEKEILNGQKPGTVNVISEKDFLKANKNDKEIIKQHNQNIKTLKRLGYYDDEDDDAELLSDMDNIVDKDLKKYTNNVESTHMRKYLNEIQLGFQFKGIPDDNDLENIAYLPSTTYVEDVGWTGVIQLFKAQNIGNCLLEEVDLKLSRSIYTLLDITVSHIINNKIAVTEVMGTKDKGFVYEVSWYDTKLARTLKCFNKEFNSNIKENVIALAKRIDN